jgi:hypothetical protein
MFVPKHRTDMSGAKSSKRPAGLLQQWAPPVPKGAAVSGLSVEGVGGSPGSVKKARSFTEQKSENEARLQAIAALPLGEFNASKMQLVAEVRAMRPKPLSGFIHEEALVVYTAKGNIYVGEPHSLKKNSLAWSVVVDVSKASGTTNLMVYRGDFREVKNFNRVLCTSCR